jgi:hypothetical protein
LKICFLLPIPQQTIALHVVLAMTELERGLSTAIYSRNGKKVAPFFGYKENVQSNVYFFVTSDSLLVLQQVLVKAPSSMFSLILSYLAVYILD